MQQNDGAENGGLVEWRNIQKTRNAFFYET